MYEYYSYFGLSAAAGLIALPIEVARQHVATLVSRHGPFIRVIGLLLALAYAGIAGTLLHGSNDLVEQANRAQRIDAYAHDLPAGTTIYFVPPVERAMQETLSGLSVATMHAERRIGVVFAGQPGVAPAERSTDLLRLTAFDDLGSGDWRVFSLDQLNSDGANADRVRLETGEELVQPFVVGRGGFTELQIRGRTYGGNCSVAYRLEQHATPASGLASSPVHVLTSGACPCASFESDRFVPVVHIPPQSGSGEVRYDLHLALTADPTPRGGRVLLKASKAHDAFLPLTRRTAQGVWQEPAPTGPALLFRVVVEPDHLGR